jgi:hypothetical protein
LLFVVLNKHGDALVGVMCFDYISQLLTQLMLITVLTFGSSLRFLVNNLRLRCILPHQLLVSHIDHSQACQSVLNLSSMTLLQGKFFLPVLSDHFRGQKG